ncbi:MAG: hypothetical protein AAGJ85_09000, partial [Pseudomonadota bacterium]
IIFLILMCFNFIRLCEDSTPSYQNYQYNRSDLDRLLEPRLGNPDSPITIREATEAEREQARRDQEMQDLIERVERARRNRNPLSPQQTEAQAPPPDKSEEASEE